MKCLFVNDHTFLYNDGKYYTSGTLNNGLLERYLQFFDDIMVLARVVNAESRDVKRIKDSNLLSSVKLDLVSKERFFLSGWEIWVKTKRLVKHSDAIIARMPSVLSSLACYHALREEKPLYVEVVGCPWDALWHHGSSIGKLAAPFMYLLTRYFVKRAPYALYVSQQFLQKRYPCDGVTISCSDANIPEVSEEVLARRLSRINRGFEGHQIRFGLIGSLDVDYKGHETAMRAMASIKEKIPAFQLHLLGAGSPARWKTLADKLGIGEQVVFSGTLPGGQAVFDWLDQMDVYLQPSLAESHGRAALEAMSRGCPIIVAKTGGLVEFTSSEWQHSAKDPIELGNLIVKIVLDKQSMRESAHYSFLKAGEFYQPKLDVIRNRFLSSFASHAREPL